MPPLCSMVLMPRGVRRRRTEWPSASDRTEATCRMDMNQAVGAGLGQPIHLGHDTWGELDAIRHDLLAVPVVPATRRLGVQELAAGVGLGELAGALVLKLVDAAQAAAVAQRFPLRF